MRTLKLICLLLGTFLASSLFAQTSDPFLTKLYDQLHGSPEQEKYKKIAPMPVGVVYVQQPGDGEKEMREHFRTMKKLGFNCLKQIMPLPGWTVEKIGFVALEEGIIPWWYGDGGWEPFSPELMKKLGLKENMPLEEVRRHPKMIAYQNEVLKKRLQRVEEYAKASPDKQFMRDRSQAYEPQIGERGLGLTDQGKKEFVVWVKKKYGSIEKLNFAWNQHHYGLQPKEGEPFKSWEDFDVRWEQISRNEYNHLIDILRFKTDHAVENIKQKFEAVKAFDKNYPLRGGGEISLFYPLAWWGVDMEKIAGLITDYGSFYPSIHFAWHFDDLNHELTRPVYMACAQTTDWFKGGWAATWESTGGPQQFSGGKGGNGFTVDDGIMTQFVLSQIAAGFKGFGIWCWNARTSGWEAGEYALLDRHNQVTDRAVKVGNIAKAMTKFREELWDARKEPVVGVISDWENDALWSAMSVANRDSFRQEPVSARVGVSRALINANVPYEYLSGNDIMKGLAPRYKVIYMPFQMGIKQEVLDKLKDYVAQGGRLVVDMPGAWFDGQAALLKTNKGSTFEQIFGATINDYQYSGVNMPWSLGSLPLKGFTIDLKPSTAKVLASYNEGKPAITENKMGKGTAVILGYEASKMCYRPGHGDAEKLLIQYALGSDIKSPYTCQGAIAYRLPSTKADHYFLMNDGPKTTASLSIPGKTYKKVTDSVTGEIVDLAKISLERYNGRWLRLEK